MLASAYDMPALVKTATQESCPSLPSSLYNSHVLSGHTKGLEAVADGVGDIKIDRVTLGVAPVDGVMDGDGEPTNKSHNHIGRTGNIDVQ